MSELKDIMRGDILVKVKVKEDEVFKLIGDDLHMNLEIGLIDAIFGAKIEVPTIEKEKKSVDIPSGVGGGEKIVLRNLGFYINENYSKRGDMILNLKVKVPKSNKLSHEDQNILKSIIKKGL